MMVPMRTSSIFKSRWMAVVWAIGILVVAWEVAASEPQTTNVSQNAEVPTDATGAPVTAEDQKRLEQALNGI
jgi:hypothetical protein